MYSCKHETQVKVTCELGGFATGYDHPVRSYAAFGGRTTYGANYSDRHVERVKEPNTLVQSWTGETRQPVDAHS